MSPARRNNARKGWPRGLYEPRPGYYVWRSQAGVTMAIGRVSLSMAKAEVNAANELETGKRPGLIERLSGATKTIGDVLDKMPLGKAKNTIKGRRSMDKAIRAGLGGVPCFELSVSQCAEFVDAIVTAGKDRTAAATRSRLVAVCKRAQQLGWMEANPAEITAVPKVEVKRGRLTFESFKAIYEKAPEVSAWLQRAMLFGLVLGADLLTLSRLQRSNAGPELLTFQRQKTKVWIAVPLTLRLDAVDTSLADLVNARGPVLSHYLLHHLEQRGLTEAGDPIAAETISKAFTDARQLAKIPDEGAPTFHELRSLSKRMYMAQGNVDTKALLGHAGERISDLYANPRGVEPVRVKIG